MACDLTPRAVRRLGQTALRRVFAQLDGSSNGDHDDHQTGAADEPTGLTRPWVFGDELPIDAPRTVSNALRRSGLAPHRCCLGRSMISRSPKPSAAISAAVALCVDLSFSMVHDGRWGPMKQTALALNHLIETRFRQDALQVIGFNRLARRMTPSNWPKRSRTGCKARTCSMHCCSPCVTASSSGCGAGRAGRH